MKILKILVKLFLSIVLSWIALLIFCHLNRSSKFYHYELNFERYKRNYKNFEESASRAKTELKNWFSASNNSNSLLFDLKDSRYMCLGIISKNRVGSDPSNYVQQAIMSILSRVSFKRQHLLRLVAFNMEDKPEENKNLLQFKDVIKIVNMSSNFGTKNVRVKEALDYSMVLKYFSKLKCDYSILSEDDAIFAHNWFEILLKNLQESDKSEFKSWFVCKLFSGYKFFDNNWIKSPSFELIFKFFYMLTILFMVQVCLKWAISRKKLILNKFDIFCFILNALIQTWFYISTSVAPEGNGFHYYWTGFGLVSALFPFRSLDALSLYLSETAICYANKSSSFFEAKDLLIDVFREKKQLKEITISPSIVQHTGMHSSLMFKDLSYNGYRRMYKSFSFIDDFKLIEFKKKLL